MNRRKFFRSMTGFAVSLVAAPTAIAAPNATAAMLEKLWPGVKFYPQQIEIIRGYRSDAMQVLCRDTVSGELCWK